MGWLPGNPNLFASSSATLTPSSQPGKTYPIGYMDNLCNKDSQSLSKKSILRRYPAGYSL
jgi:hypothetical protein